MYKPTSLAGEPSRSSGTITVSWGLMSIPLAVYSGSESVNVARNEYVDGLADHPAGRAIIDKTTGDIVTSDRIRKLAKATDGSLVELSDDEIAACTSPKGLAEIVSFVPPEGIWEYVPEDIAQVRPPSTKGKIDHGVSMAFSLLIQAMKERNVCALVKFSIRNAARFALITPDGYLIYVKTADQIRKAKALPVAPVDPKYLDLAMQLIDQVGKGAPVLKNDTAEKIREYVDVKATTGAVSVPTTPTIDPDADVAALLIASLGLPA